MPLRKGPDVALLLLSGAFLTLNFLALGAGRSSAHDPVHWLHLLVWLAGAVAGQVWLGRHLPQRDKLLFPLIMLQAGWGLLLQDRLFPSFADRQTLWLAAGLTLALVLASWRQLPDLPQRFSRLSLPGIAILLVAAIVLEGESAGLPDELLKLLLIVHFCVWLADCPPGKRAQDWLVRQGWRALLWLVPLLVLVWQRDPGTALVAGLVLLILVNLAAGARHLLPYSLLLLLTTAVAAWFLLDVVQDRVSIWLDPWSDAAGSGYQIVQGLMAFAEGGIAGAGVGQGQPLVIPVVHSDFVPAALAEEWGLTGVLVLLGSMALYTLRGLNLAWRLRYTRFYSLLAAAMTLLPAVQGLIISAGVLRLMPLAGVTLPFLGYGGSSMLTSWLAASLLIRLSAVAAQGRP